MNRLLGDFDPDAGKFGLRAAQAALAVISLGLVADVIARINGLVGAAAVPGAYGYTLFVAIMALLLALLFALGPLLHNRYGWKSVKYVIEPRTEMALTALWCVLWLAAFIAVTVRYSGIS